MQMPKPTLALNRRNHRRGLRAPRIATGRIALDRAINLLPRQRSSMPSYLFSIILHYSTADLLLSSASHLTATAAVAGVDYFDGDRLSDICKSSQTSNTMTRCLSIREPRAEIMTDTDTYIILSNGKSWRAIRPCSQPGQRCG